MWILNLANWFVILADQSLFSFLQKYQNQRNKKRRQKRIKYPFFCSLLFAHYKYNKLN